MAVVDRRRVERAFAELVEAARAQQAAIEELRAEGVLRSRNLVGDLGEYVAARFYGGELSGPGEPGYDVLAPDGRRVQVRTLRVTPHNRRTVMGVMREPYDVLFALRIDEHYAPLEAFEAPREVVDELFPGRRVTWTRRLASDSRVRVFGRAALMI
jgi:hypothetical protein